MQQRNLGVTTTSRTGMRDSKKKKTENISKTNAAISEALEKGYLIVCIIDDYHHYHAIRRPDSEQTSSGADMCTTVIRIFPSIRTLPRNWAGLQGGQLGRATGGQLGRATGGQLGSVTGGPAVQGYRAAAGQGYRGGSWAGLQGTSWAGYRRVS